MASEKERLDSVIQSLQSRHMADGAVTAMAATGIWDLLAAKFGSLIGLNGVVLLYSRSLERTRTQFPWLPPSIAGGRAPAEPLFAALGASMAGQTPAAATAGHQALLENFIRLLASLIGAGLTVQFLRSLFPDASANQNSQEKPE
jgi:hypothetical protein